MHNIKEILISLINYYDSTRRGGHTTMMMEGAKDNDGILLCHTKHVGEMLKKKYKNNKLQIITPYNLGEQLRGRKKPLVIDNSVLYTLLWDCLAEINRLEKDNRYIIK